MKTKRIFAGIAAAGALAGGGTVVADQAINPYETVGQTLQIADESVLPEGGVSKIVVDKTQPKITLQKWNGEVVMGVRYIGMTATGDRPFLSKAIEWKSGTQELHAYPLDKSEEMEDGGFEIEVRLNEKPNTNVFDFAIDGADQLDFFYQPPLSDEQIASGQTRPNNVVGSYAVYYKNHANHVEGETNYATGKAYHIYRPKAVDALGNQTWAQMSYEAGVLSITVPQSFLDNAVYPVDIDPTFGRTSLGATCTTYEIARSGVAGTTRIRGGVFTSPDSGTVSSISVGLRIGTNDAAVNVKAGFYLRNGNGADSHTLIGSSNESKNITSTGAFQAFTVSGSITPTDYILVAVGDPSTMSGNNGLAICSDTASAMAQVLESGVTFASVFASPWSNTPTGLTDWLSIFATYTAAGGGSTPPSADVPGLILFGDL